MKLFDELKWRGLIKDMTSPEIEDKINNGGMTFYIGTDPTGDSLHLGHLSSFLIAKRLKDGGHHPILLIGGATGRIGDPKPNAEREMKSVEEIEHNIKGLTEQVKKLFGFEVVNNYDWTKDLTVIDFFRDFGKYINLNYMLDKDIIRRRMETGITYAEFSYMLLQAMDFYHLYVSKDCTMQVAGSDQWGNITAGVDLIRKKLGKEAYAFTMPLVTDKAGNKFGKSEGNALWLDRDKTSPYAMYQFLLNVEDEMVIDYLKIFTFLTKEEIEALAADHSENPHLRHAHKALAREVVTFLHGEEGYKEALKITDTLFGGDIRELSTKELKDGLKDAPHTKIADGTNICDVLVACGACKSKREARDLIKGNSIAVNGEKISDFEYVIAKKDAFDKELTIIKKGRKNWFVLEFEG